MMRTAWWRPLVATLAVACTVTTAFGCSSATTSADEGPFSYDADAPLDVVDLGVVDPDYPLAVHDISYHSGDDVVEAYLVVPPGDGPWPAAVYVHGAGADRRSMLAPAAWLAARGAVTIAISAPSAATPQPSGSTARERLEEHRGLEVGDVVAVRRALDVLSERDDVDPSRLAYVGWSAGARAGAILAGVEPRLRRLVLLAPGSAPVSDFVEAASPADKDAVREIMSSVDPLAYIARGPEGAILIQNGTEDNVIPRAALDAIVAAAPKGTDARWYAGAGHEVGFQAYREHLDWLQEELGMDGPPVPGAQTGPDPDA
jgi:dienelactone hydrolase